MQTSEIFLKSRDEAGAEGRLCYEYVGSLLQYPLRVQSIKERLHVYFPQERILNELIFYYLRKLFFYTLIYWDNSQQLKYE